MPEDPAPTLATREDLLRAQGERVRALGPQMASIGLVPVAALGLTVANVGVFVLVLGVAAVATGEEGGAAMVVLALGIAAVGGAVAGWRLSRLRRLYEQLRYWRHVDRFAWARRLPAGSVPTELATPYDARDRDDFEAASRAHGQRQQRRAGRFSVLGAIACGFPLVPALLVVVAPLTGAGILGDVDTATRGTLSALGVVVLTATATLCWWALGADGISRQRTLNEADFDHGVYAVVRHARGHATDAGPQRRSLLGSRAVAVVWGISWSAALVVVVVTAEPTARWATLGLVVLALSALAVLVVRRRRLHLVALDEPDPTRPDEAFPRRTPVTVTEVDGGWRLTPAHGDPFEVAAATLQGAGRVRDALALTSTWVVVTGRGPLVLAGAGVASLPLVVAARQAGITAS